jgi:hypothetical protein
MTYYSTSRLIIICYRVYSLLQNRDFKTSMGTLTTPHFQDLGVAIGCI